MILFMQTLTSRTAATGEHHCCCLCETFALNLAQDRPAEAAQGGVAALDASLELVSIPVAPSLDWSGY